MSEVVEEAKVAEGFLRRTFDAEFSTSDGRTIDTRIVPYGVAAEVSDGGPVYREMWMPGSFSNQARGAEAGRARKVYVNYRHQQGFGDVIGHGLTLEEKDDGFYGSFRILDGPDGDKALELVRADALSGVSLEAYSKKMQRSKDGIVQRIKGHLVGIALCPQGAFPAAGVLAIREEPEELAVDEDMLPPAPDKQFLERCARLGIAIPETMETMLARAFTEQPWDSDESRWETSADYAAACAIDLNKPDKTKARMLCHLPYKEPGSGMVNVNGVRAALASLERGAPRGVPQLQRDSAQTMLEGLLASFKGIAPSLSKRGRRGGEAA